ncbi:MAG: DUF2807 domain-containing protein [Flavobacteriales bacterium]|nr:DUF2807 domain-containing protein [Flavobacteriales bacterium]
MKGSQFIIIFFLASIFLGCQKELTNHCLNTNKLISQTLEFKDFDRLQINTPGTINIQYGEKAEVHVYGPKRFIKELEKQSEWSKGELELNAYKCLKNPEDVIIDIYMPSLEYVEAFQYNILNIKDSAGHFNISEIREYANGKVGVMNIEIARARYLDLYTYSSILNVSFNRIDTLFLIAKIRSNINLTGDSISLFDYNSSSSGDIKINHIDSFSLSQVGNGDIYFTGFCDYFRLYGYGNSNIKAFNMPADTVDIDISGNLIAEVSVHELLKGSCKGSGQITYEGWPAVDVRVLEDGKLYKAQ